ncbi:unnamed protein product [Paramecium octaurelia]|uniref:Senescence domain-containing protein n=1 Tax=Paramecium octaurelia TaxID=43137 RepID=A0A8S1WTN2_PAROT|nr:unnamed protein product [Paramecium octaurelia]
MQQEQPREMAQVVSIAENAQFFRLIQNSRTKVFQGTVKLAQFQDSKTHFITIERFCQNIVPGTPFVYISCESGLTLIFPHIDQGLNGIFIPQSDLLNVFHTALNTVVSMVPFDQAMQIQQFKDTIELHCKDIATNPLNNPNDAAAYIVKGGDYLKKGFMFLGTMMATGINKGTQYLNDKIQPGQEVQVDPNTKTKLQATKEKVSEVFDVTGQYLGQLFKPVAQKTKELTNELGQKIDNSDSHILKQSKQLTSATWDAAGTALSGLGTALCQVGSSIGNGTKQIVQKKYGTEVVNTYLGGDQQQQQVQQEQQQQQQQLDQYQPLIEEQPAPSS